MSTIYEHMSTIYELSEYYICDYEHDLSLYAIYLKAQVDDVFFPR